MKGGKQARLGRRTAARVHGWPAIADFVLDIFTCMEIAEEEVAAGYLRHPKCATAIDRVFAIACPTGPLRAAGCARELYRSHVRELVERAASWARATPKGKRSERWREGTLAEIVAVLSYTSTVAPLTREGQSTYERVFALLWPDKARELFPDGPSAEPWDNACEDEVARLRRKLADDKRVFEVP